MNKRRLTISLCAASFLQMGALATASGMADMVKAFPDVPVTLVQLLTTLPILIQTPVTLFATFFCRFLSKKKLLILACVFFLTGGLIPFFIHNFLVIVIIRCLYGAAVGLVIPLVTALAGEHFEGGKRAGVLGLASAIGMLGGAFYTFAGGLLSVAGWNYCFLTYLVGIPVLIIVASCLEDEGIRHAVPANHENKGSRSGLPAMVFVIALGSLVYLVLYFAYTNTISLFVAAEHIGNSADAGISYSLVNICGFIGGLLFGKLHRRLREMLVPLCVGVTMAGFVIIAISETMPVLLIGSVLIGLGISWFLPETQYIISAVVRPEQLTLAYGVNGAITNAGQILSSPIFAFLAAALGIATERGVILSAGIGYIALTVICVPFGLYLLKKIPGTGEERK